MTQFPNAAFNWYPTTNKENAELPALANFASTETSGVSATEPVVSAPANIRKRTRGTFAYEIRSLCSSLTSALISSKDLDTTGSVEASAAFQHPSGGSVSVRPSAGKARRRGTYWYYSSTCTRGCALTSYLIVLVSFAGNGEMQPGFHQLTTTTNTQPPAWRSDAARATNADAEAAKSFFQNSTSNQLASNGKFQSSASKSQPNGSSTLLTHTPTRYCVSVPPPDMGDTKPAALSTEGSGAPPHTTQPEFHQLTTTTSNTQPPAWRCDAARATHLAAEAKSSFQNSTSNLIASNGKFQSSASQPQPNDTSTLTHTPTQYCVSVPPPDMGDTKPAALSTEGSGAQPRKKLIKKKTGRELQKKKRVWADKAAEELARHLEDQSAGTYQGSQDPLLTGTFEHRGGKIPLANFALVDKTPQNIWGIVRKGQPPKPALPFCTFGPKGVEFAASFAGNIANGIVDKERCYRKKPPKNFVSAEAVRQLESLLFVNGSEMLKVPQFKMALASALEKARAETSNTGNQVASLPTSTTDVGNPVASMQALNKSWLDTFASESDKNRALIEQILTNSDDKTRRLLNDANTTNAKLVMDTQSKADDTLCRVLKDSQSKADDTLCRVLKDSQSNFKKTMETTMAVCNEATHRLVMDVQDKLGKQLETLIKINNNAREQLGDQLGQSVVAHNDAPVSDAVLPNPLPFSPATNHPAVGSLGAGQSAAFASGSANSFVAQPTPAALFGSLPGGASPSPGLLVGSSGAQASSREATTDTMEDQDSDTPMSA